MGHLNSMLIGNRIARAAAESAAVRAARNTVNRRDPEHPDFEGFSDYDAVCLAEGIEQPISQAQYLGAWQHLVNTGLAWRLQGWFGRTARALIEAGEIEEPGRAA